MNVLDAALSSMAHVTRGHIITVRLTGTKNPSLCLVLVYLSSFSFWERFYVSLYLSWSSAGGRERSELPS